MDVTDADQTRALVDRCTADLGKIDVLLNCPSILTRRAADGDGPRV